MGIWNGVWGGTVRGRWERQADDPAAAPVAVAASAHKRLLGWD
jgi:hypothetical protein